MIVVDTNILVRFIANDDPKQVNLVKEILNNRQYYIPKTVFLKLAWVLASNRFNYNKNDIEIALNGLLKHPNVIIEDILQIRCALKWYSAGIELDDALHLSAGLGANEFITFDHKLIKKAAKIAQNFPLIINPQHKI